MSRREALAGPNFSGRSAALLAMLRERAAPAFFVGPYAEAALSGLTSSVADELALYHGEPPRPRPPLAALDLAGLARRKPQSLSGGEQVLLALHCFAQSAYGAIAVDTALEQLDPANRVAALAFLDSGAFDVALIDNRIVPHAWERRDFAAADGYRIDWPTLAQTVTAQDGKAIAITGLDFAYARGRQIFSKASVTLAPGTAHRLSGANGAGKTTFLKLLVGALAPGGGEARLGGEPYRPWRDGNGAFALATQNPDQQWCGATLREDLARRQHALGTRAHMIEDARMSTLATALGIESLDANLYELPLAARKRVSWLWPLAGAHPWIMLDEPTLGQDSATREQFARLIGTVCAHGYGVIFVTHDDEFAAMLPHRRLLIENCAISSPAQTAE